MVQHQSRVPQARELVNGMQQAMPAWAGNAAAFPPEVVASQASQTMITVGGGDIPHGLGWIILAMAAAVALLPLLSAARRENREQQRAMTLIGMIVGTILVMYLGATSYRDMDVGFLLVIAGYIIMWVAIAREYLRPALRPTIALHSS